MEQELVEVKQREVVAWQPRVCNLAAQILLHACGKQQFRTTISDYFAKLAAANDSGLQQAAAGMGMQLAQLGAEADDVLTRRNVLVHPGSLESLEVEVNAVRSCITTLLEQACRQECRIVRAYEIFKGAFPERFK
ncbi:hypothetical protein HXX76_013921 [Chlamydomonas incerta]|uniref:Uncharacterized protein n=1 Tax=Chlamydomonas incerta TaxID=51695 RepID=A0A835SDA1_CHLIN|nr:hypothetical protein HXX76_013921 [Chlamydomonas incerta]|eukprot:KAG2425167.1 hypothetical protein HXX76_013921 [Chlamydomonas incerta]